MCGIEPRVFSNSGIECQALRDVPVGTAASVRSTEALQCLIEASAFSILIHQRPPTPSCRGHSSYCGENTVASTPPEEHLRAVPNGRHRPKPQETGQTPRPARGQTRLRDDKGRPDPENNGRKINPAKNRSAKTNDLFNSFPGFPYIPSSTPPPQPKWE